MENSEIWTIEKRVCGDCRNIKVYGLDIMPTCSVHLMSVARKFQMAYKTKEGTCFEYKPGQTSMCDNCYSWTQYPYYGFQICAGCRKTVEACDC